MYFSELPSRCTDTENCHSWYTMLESYKLQQAPKKMPLPWSVWQGEGPIFHAVQTFLLYSTERKAGMYIDGSSCIHDNGLFCSKKGSFFAVNQLLLRRQWSRKHLWIGGTKVYFNNINNKPTFLIRSHHRKSRLGLNIGTTAGRLAQFRGFHGFVICTVISINSQDGDERLDTPEWD